jgi:hypothetical protein
VENEVTSTLPVVLNSIAEESLSSKETFEPDTTCEDEVGFKLNLDDNTCSEIPTAAVSCEYLNVGFSTTIGSEEESRISIPEIQLIGLVWIETFEEFAFGEASTRIPSIRIPPSESLSEENVELTGMRIVSGFTVLFLISSRPDVFEYDTLRSVELPLK